MSSSPVWSPVFSSSMARPTKSGWATLKTLLSTTVTSPQSRVFLYRARNGSKRRSGFKLLTLLLQIPCTDAARSARRPSPRGSDSVPMSAATMRGRASAEPLSVWTISGFPPPRAGNGCSSDAPGTTRSCLWTTLRAILLPQRPDFQIIFLCLGETQVARAH